MEEWLVLIGCTPRGNLLTLSAGAPLDIAPFQDDRSLAKDDTEVNNFHYEDNDADTTNPHSRCPFSAHIRKTNPRSDLPAQVMAAERVLRRGIPYGPEVDPSETTAKTSSHDRGLLFVCYQSHLANGFELMQKCKLYNRQEECC